MSSEALGKAIGDAFRAGFDFPVYEYPPQGDTMDHTFTFTGSVDDFGWEVLKLYSQKYPNVQNITVTMDYDLLVKLSQRISEQDVAVKRLQEQVQQLQRALALAERDAPPHITDDGFAAWMEATYPDLWARWLAGPRALGEG